MRAGREFGPERENQNNGVRAGFQHWTKYSNPEMQSKPMLDLHRVCGMRTLLSFPIQQPRTSDSSPHDFETWRVLLPSRPEEERVARLVAHENASGDFASDLALLQLRTRVNLTAAPSAVCLPYREHYFLPGSRCRLARWGRGGARGRAGPRTGWGGRSGNHAAEATPPHPPAALSRRTRARLQCAAGGTAVEQLVVSLPVRPPGGVRATARRPAALALPRLSGRGRGGPMLGERQELAAEIRS